MTWKNSLWMAAVTLAALVGADCSGRKTSTLPPVPPNNDADVFIDDFGSGVDFQAFMGSNVTAVSIDTNTRHQGSASLKVTVPAPGDPNGAWAGGAFTTNLARDLSGYNALTFWAKSSVPTTLNVVGLGNDNTGNSRYSAEWHDVPLTTSWTKYVVPVPLPAKLTVEKGLFFFAEAPEGATGHLLWFDDVKFDSVATISNPRPAMTPATVSGFVGTTITPTGTQVTFDVGGTDEVIKHLPGYFTFLSSDETVATVTGGEIRVVGGGHSTISARLGGIPVTGELNLNAIAPPSVPAPTPTYPAGDVISLFSNAYTDVPVDTWSANWGRADLTSIKIAGNDVKAYANLVFTGIEFITTTIDATAMTHFHLDIWVPGGSVFKVKLVDFGADGVYGGGNDTEHELSFTAISTPPLVTGAWVPLDLPLTSFTTLASRAHLAQIVISGDVGTVYVDNVLFRR
jgi:hypothetical protein